MDIPPDRKYLPYIEAFNEAIDGILPFTARDLESFEEGDTICTVYKESRRPNATTKEYVGSIFYGGKTANAPEGDGLRLYWHGDEVWTPWPHRELSIYIGKRKLSVLEMNDALRITVRAHADCLTKWGSTTRMNFPVTWEKGVRTSPVSCYTS